MTSRLRLLSCCSLLALASAAAAQQPAFAEFARGDTPFPRPLTTPDRWASPSFIDIDGDGDLDLVTGDDSYTVSLFERTPTGLELPRPITGIANRHPAFDDLDGDGDLDLVYSRSFCSASTCGYYEQTSPGTFTLRSGAANPFASYGITTENSATPVPAFGDVNGDGRADLVVGDFEGRIHYAERQADGSFVRRTGAQNPFNGILRPFYVKLALGDMDGDGDDDLVFSSSGLFYYENVGGAFVERTGTSNPIGTWTTSFSRPHPAIQDVDGDGDDDVVVGDEYGVLYLLEQKPTGFALSAEPYSAFGGFAFSGFGGAANLTDVDGDGDLDLVYISGVEGIYLENVGLPGEPFRRQWGSLNPFDSVREDGYGFSFGDADDDGDDDLLVAGPNGRSRYYRREGPMQFFLQPDASNPFRALGLTQDFVATFGDTDGDGDDDFIVREGYAFRYFEHVAPAGYVEHVGTDSPTYLLDMRHCANASVPAYTYGEPTTVDLDVDGDDDLVSGSCVFLNEVGAFTTVYANNPLAGIAGLQQNVDLRTFGDLTGDGYPEMVVVGSAGSTSTLRAFRNLGVYTATEPATDPDGAFSSDGYTLSAPAPNPGVSSVRVSLAVAQGQRVRALLYDALGRRVALLYDGPVAATTSLPLAVDVTTLPAGAYVVRVEGETFSASRRVTIAH